METNLPLVHQESRPKYRVIEDWLRAQIDDGRLAPGSKLPSEHDLARTLGVAYMTVRSAINVLVRDGLLQRVHGKGTFVMAHAAPESSAETLALVVPSLSLLWNVAGLYYFPPIVQGFCSEATRLGYEPVVMSGSKEFFSLTSEHPSRCAGMACMLVTQEDVRTIEHLRDRSTPVVAINSYRGRRLISCVAADQAQGAVQVVKLLAQLGHRRIAFLDGPPGNLGASERLRGFREGMARHHLEPMPVDDTGPLDYSDHSGLVRTRRILAQEPRPTAIFAAGDALAAGAVQAAREAGLSVPDDLSVVGFGDFHLAQHVHPTLTTAHLPLEELGAWAVRLLDKRLSGVSGRQVIELPVSLVMRDSVAAAPDSESHPK
jgi:LacI family transcriptional regulator